MADVARRAGVHQTTVSRALRGDPALPATTRQRLVALAEKMGYRRNPLVSALIAERRRGRPSGHGAVLGILSAGEDPEEWRRGSDTYSRLHHFLAGQAYRLGYGLEEFALNAPGVSADRLRRILQARGVRGLVLGPMPMEVEEVEFDFSQFAAVALRLRLRRPALDRVAPDYFTAMGEAVEKLSATGHRRLSFLSDNKVDERVRHRSLGAYLAARQGAPSRFVAPLVISRWSKPAFFSWMKKNRPDAILTPIQADYLRVRQWLQDGGWEAPRELSLVCLDCHRDTAEAGIVQNLELEAASAIKLLAHKVEGADFGVPADACRLVVPGRWRDGELFAARVFGIPPIKGSRPTPSAGPFFS